MKNTEKWGYQKRLQSEGYIFPPLHFAFGVQSHFVSHFALSTSFFCLFNIICFSSCFFFFVASVPLIKLYSHFSSPSFQFLVSTQSLLFLLTPFNIFLPQMNLVPGFPFRFLCMCVSFILVNSLLHEANLVSTKCTMFRELPLIAVVLLMSGERGNRS